MLKNFYMVASDDKFVSKRPIKQKTRKVLSSYKYRNTGLFPIRQDFNEYAVPLPFRTTPDSLLNLSIRVLELFPMPEVYRWTSDDVCNWLKECGYPQYIHTFRVNLINGRRLLLLDASSLPAMNIKDFDHIRHITYGIRALFHFEVAKFGRSIALPPELHLELYKLMRVKNGTKYEQMSHAQLWRRMQLIREQSSSLSRNHWDILKDWQKIGSDKEDSLIVGGKKSVDIFKHCAINMKQVEPLTEIKLPCKCIPPCQCDWGKRQVRSPWRLKCLTKFITSSSGNKDDVLSVLHKQFPDRYSLRVRSGDFDYLEMWQ